MHFHEFAYDWTAPIFSAKAIHIRSLSSYGSMDGTERTEQLGSELGLPKMASVRPVLFLEVWVATAVYVLTSWSYALR